MRGHILYFFTHLENQTVISHDQDCQNEAIETVSYTVPALLVPVDTVDSVCECLVVSRPATLPPSNRRSSGLLLSADGLPLVARPGVGKPGAATKL
jgi:hypothetical protein